MSVATMPIDWTDARDLLAQPGGQQVAEDRIAERTGVRVTLRIRPRTSALEPWSPEARHLIDQALLRLGPEALVDACKAVVADRAWPVDQVPDVGPGRHPWFWCGKEIAAGLVDDRPETCLLYLQMALAAPWHDFPSSDSAKGETAARAERAADALCALLAAMLLRSG